MLLPAVCLAQPGEPPKGPPPEEKGDKGAQQRAMMEAWKNADKDHDGFISKEEFDAMPRILNLPGEKRAGIFARLDKNGDGKLATDELGRMGKPRDGQPMKRLWELDADKSGGISFEEFKAGQVFMKLPPERQEKVFKRLDTDGDGLITPKDKPEPPFKHGEGREGKDGKRPDRPDRPGDDDDGAPRKPDGMKPDVINRKLDTNGDGALTFEEFRAGNAVKNLTEDEQEDRFELLDRNGDLKISPEDFPPPQPPPAPAPDPAPKPAE